MKKWPKILSTLLAALVLGAMLTFAFAPYEIFPLAVLSLCGLLALWLKASPRLAFWSGFSFGIGLFSTGLYWVFISIHQFGDVPNGLALLITSGLILFMALFPAMTGYLSNRYFPFTHTTKTLCVFPALWVLSEWIRSFLFTGFPWLLLGYTQTNSPLKGIAPILGVYGVSLAVFMTSALLVNAVVQFKQHAYRYAYFNLFGLVLLWTASNLFCFIPWTQADAPPIPVSLVQGNIPQSIKWSPSALHLSFERYTQLTNPLWQKGRIIIWPEAAIPLPLQDAASFINQMDSRAKQAEAHLILGIPIQTQDGKGYNNAVVVLGGHGDQVYLKRRLVPFGEYTPLLDFTSRFIDLKRILQFMDIPMTDTLPGKVDQAPLQVGDTKILTSICYEIAFPELIRSRDSHIGLLLTVSNDAWFGKSTAQAQHLQIAMMRAMEFERPLLFVSNDGITAIIGPRGKIEAVAPTRTEAVLNATVQPRSGLTPWMQNGADPVRFILVCLLIVAIRTKMGLRAKQREALPLALTPQPEKKGYHSN